VRETSILVIDDVTDIVAEMIAMFRLAGLHCIGTGSIDDGLARLHDDVAINLIICDLRLRHEDGLSLVARLRDDPALASRAIPIMFMTGDGTDPVRLQQLPGVTLLRKPIDPDLLIRLVHERLNAGAA
jgi:CheY-like chemotaxis protein